MELRYGSASVVLDDPDFPYTYSWKTKQTMLESEGGQRYVYDFGIRRRVWLLKWNLLDSSQFSRLENFILNTVNFRETPFTFVDHTNTAYTVRCTAFSFSQVTPTHYAVNLTLEEEV